VLLHGPNGAGKTNLLEALHVGTQGFSPRARRDAQMIRFGSSAGRVALGGSLCDGGFETDVVLTAGESRRVSLNGAQLNSSERLRHELTTLVFTPDRLAVVKGGPATRRAYFDRALGRLFPARASLASDYASAVGQRNAGLRRIRLGQSTRDALAPWSEGVVDLGRNVVASRIAALDLLRDRFTAAAAELGLGEAGLAYEGAAPSLDDLRARLEVDLERGTTGLGPHLHDVRIEAGGRDLRSYGSQGEQRIAVLALVLAEAEALLVRTGSSPLVLLDDVLSELDEGRRAALAELLAPSAQTVVTTTSASAFPGEPALSLAVTPGKVG
jgi:DNA replication and repair protein RecF